MDDDPRALRVPDCVRGVGTTRSRCRDGNVSLYYDDRVAVTMTAINIDYMTFLAGKALYAVRLNVCPYTQVSDIVRAMDPLVDPPVTESPFDEVIFATALHDTGRIGDRPTHSLRRFPEYVVLISSEEVSDLVMEKLYHVELFGVECNPVRIGPGHNEPWARIRLLGYPPIPFGRRIENPDDVVMLLRECCPLHRQDQLARVLENSHVCAEMIIQVLYDELFPGETGEEY